MFVCINLHYSLSYNTIFFFHELHYSDNNQERENCIKSEYYLLRKQSIHLKGKHFYLSHFFYFVKTKHPFIGSTSQNLS